MIQTFKKLFFTKKLQKTFSVEVSVIKRQFGNLILENSRLIHVDGFVYSEADYNKFKSSLEERLNYESAIKLLHKNLMLDNFYIYYLQNGIKSYIITFFDPFEYTMDAILLDIIEVDNRFLDDSNKENLLK
ncbi:MAG: hypothetical protein WAS56_12085 [Saprospiraceae bacterium]